MRSDPKQLAHEAINLELNTGKLYEIFSYAWPEDSDFWWKLAMEEKNHAALIKSGVDFFMDQGLFPYEILLENLENLRSINQELNEMIQQYNAEPPSRENAFKTALKVECSAGETHFQNMMNCKDGGRMLELFQKLNGDDKDHAKRIQTYMTEKDIK